MLNGVGDTVGSAADKVGGTAGTVADKAKVPALVGTVAAAGLMGGVLGSRALSRGKAASRIPTPGIRNGVFRTVAHEVQQVGKEIGKTGFRVGIGDVSMEVQKGERSKDTRDSPLEVLLNGLTQRRAKR